MTTLGTIGAGHIGSAVARVALDAGYDVVLSNSRGPASLADLVAELSARPTARGSVRAATAWEAAEAADLALVTIPLHALAQVPAEPLAGTVVIDTGNYYPQRDGRIAELDEGRATSSELLQRHLPSSSVVKAFNHIAAAQIVDHRAPAGTPNRRALAVAADDTTAEQRVAAFLDEIGFDVVDLGSLADSWRIEPGTPGYGAEDDAEQLRAHLAAATRG
ncbi:NADPH-dependent F420 reductase [Blastococcus litoris]|uniref:NADPH-dependent F420 reductase n=1 Tax=Blastococcus litoris TaxID=2171622 RepID=UPI000E309D34|nr:NAD(P)-binding domain-containing protein [Blastococcus litoris]